jgi:hypothetical protein
MSRFDKPNKCTCGSPAVANGSGTVYCYRLGCYRRVTSVNNEDATLMWNLCNPVPRARKKVKRAKA